MTYRIAVVSGGLRSPSSTRLLADELARESAREIERRGESVGVSMIELREHAHAIADAMLTGFAAGGLTEVVGTITAADALIVVSPTFSASVSGLFKSFFDIVEPGALAGKPVLLAATGGSERHSLMPEYVMRPLFSYLKALPLSTAVFGATADFGGAGTADLTRRVRQAASELADRLAQPTGAPTGPPPAPSTTPDPVPFEQLFDSLTAR